MGYVGWDVLNRENLGYFEELFEKYQQDPNQVDPSWRAFFNDYADGGYAVPSVASSPSETPASPQTVTGSSRSESIFDFLRRVPVLQNLDEPNLRRFAEITQEIVFQEGDLICRTGQTGNDLYFIENGTVAVIREGRFVTELGPGEVVGELAVFDHRPRSADIKATTECKMLQIKREDLHELLAKDVNLAIGLMRILASRLRDAGSNQERVDNLIRAYRERGHVMAKLDPLGRSSGDHPELSLAHYGFSENDLNQKFSAKLGREAAGRSLREIVSRLRDIYCQSIGAQYMHVDDMEIQEWVRLRLESYGGHFRLNRDEQLHVLKKLTDAEVFESFLHLKFPGAKRFSLEGAESMIPLLEIAIEMAGSVQIDEVVIGMAHRGRLNVLVNILDKPASQVFREFRDKDPERNLGSGDVKYHLGYSQNHMTAAGHPVHISLCFNPSHLEFVGPVVLGRARAKQDEFGDKTRDRALPLIIHGDSAFAGQGVVQEMLNLSELPGYTTGGAVHLIINNQIGFTTGPEQGRSCQYATDVARMLQIPIFHVNGEDPGAVAEVIKMAMDFRREFKKDVVIDMYCYRKYGHNEGDEPAFTQPLEYKKIKRRSTVREEFVKNILKLGEVTQAEADQILEDSKAVLEEALETASKEQPKSPATKAKKGMWAPYQGGSDVDVPDVPTNYPLQDLQDLLTRMAILPDGFTPHPKVKRFLEHQAELAKDPDAPLNWGLGESLAFATLLQQGHSIRMTGQDSERGTFSHRHAILHDFKTDERHAPLQTVAESGASLELYNSPLSEVAVLGFEYGYSLDAPNRLVIWEAQFGDFCNVAQVIIDQFISSSEDKWRRLSGLCLFLPHGFEGQGPEHSSARLERFLMLAAEDNMQIVNLTTPAQLFHCLRRQVLRPFRKPLIVMSPKSLLRHPRATSTLQDLAEGEFHRVITDDWLEDTKKVRRILICSGKIYYDLLEWREQAGIDDVALLRLEQYYPFPMKALGEALAAFSEDCPAFWVQEEPHNMGAWPFLKLKLGHSIPLSGCHALTCISRRESSSPATGSSASHKIEQEALMRQAFSFPMLDFEQALEAALSAHRKGTEKEG